MRTIPVTDNFCKICGSTDLEIQFRLEALPIGRYSLSGVQMKFSAREHPYMVCNGCKKESRGK